MISKFNKFKNKLVKRNVNKFMLHEFSNFARLDNDDSFQFLMLLVEKDELSLRFKTKCSECGNYKILNDEGKDNEVEDLYCECDKCHKKTKITKKNVYPFFEIK